MKIYKENNIPKIGNPIERVNMESDRLSNTTIPDTDIFYYLPTNFVDINGKNPNLKDKISTKNIVFEKEELTDNNWLFTLHEYKDVVEKIFKTPSKWKWIVIRSEEIVKEMQEQEELQRQKELQARSEAYDNYKIKTKLDEINPELIVSRHNNLEDFQKSHPEYSGEMINKFQNGDEIWNYDSTILSHEIYEWGHFISCFLLIRNHAIIYSPLMGVCNR